MTTPAVSTPAYRYLPPAERKRAAVQAAAQTQGLPPIALRYRRLSGQEQKDEGLSFPVQDEEVDGYVADHHWDYGDFFEDVIGGDKDARPGYQRLLAAARRLTAEGRRVVVVVIRLDRFGRSIMERARARNELTKLGVVVHSTREGGAVAPLTDAVLAVIAEHFLVELSEKVGKTAAYVIRHGWLFPGVLPLGYDWRPATKAERGEGSPKVVAEADPETAPLVQEAYARAAAGETTREIARWLHRALSGPDDAKAVQATYGLVRRLLRSPLYVARHPSTLGADAQDGEADWVRVLEHPAGRWPALVTEKVWLEAQRQRVARRTGAPARASWDGEGRPYPLTGYATCPECRAPMHGEQTRQKHTGKRVGEKEYVLFRYRCSSRMLSPGGASGCASTLSADRLERAVAEELAPLVETATRLAADPELRVLVRQKLARREAARAAAGDPAEASAEAAQAELVRLTQRLQALEAERAEMTRQYARKETTYEDYRAAMDALTADREEAKTASLALEERLNAADASAARRRTQPASDVDPVDAALAEWAAFASAVPTEEGAGPVVDHLTGSATALRVAVQGLVAPRGIAPSRPTGRGRATIYRAGVALSEVGERLRGLTELLAPARP